MRVPVRDRAFVSEVDSIAGGSGCSSLRSRQCCGPSSLGGCVEIVSLKVLPYFWCGCDERTKFFCPCVFM